MYSLVYVGRDCVASGHYDCTVTVWHAPSGALRHTLRGHTQLVWSLAMATDSVLASGSWDHSIRLWDMGTGECRCTLENAHGDAVCCLLMHESLLVSSSRDSLIKVWRMPSGDAVTTLPGHTNCAISLTNVDATHIASGNWDGTVRIWSMLTLTCERTIANACGGKAVHYMVSLGPWLMCRDCDDATDAIQYLRVWDALTGQSVRTLEQPKRHKDNAVRSMVFIDGVVVVGERGYEGHTPSILMWCGVST